MTIPSQGETDFDNPREHFLWSLRGLTWGDSVAVIPRPILEKWSKHLVDTGAVHVSALWKLADKDGLIHINDLPRQTIKYLAPNKGADHQLNGSGRWVPVEHEEPDLEISPEQAEILKTRMKELGYL